MKHSLLVAAAFLVIGCAGNEKTVETTDSPLADCDITIGDIHFTKSLNDAASLVSVSGGTVTFDAAAHTDYFISPSGTVRDNAPILLTEVDNTKPFTFQAFMTPGFTEKGSFNAAALYIFSDPELWQKFAFEQDMRGLHRVVTVRTIGTSDDNTHEPIQDTGSVWYRISSNNGTLMFSFSVDCQSWQLVRMYRNEYPEKLYLGISSQGPSDDTCRSTFEKVTLVYGSPRTNRPGNPG